MPRAATRSEASIQKAVVDYAKKRGCIAIKQSTARRFGTAGWPDYLFISPGGEILFLEFKRPGGRPTPLQARRMEELAANGVEAYTVDNVEVGKCMIDALVSE